MTSDNGGKPRRARRRLTGEEHALWTSVTQSVAPLRRRKKSGTPAEEAAASDEAENPQPPLRASPPPTKSRPASHRPPTPPLAPLGRRLKQQVARGHSPIDARIDLHGMTQDRAHSTLLRFLRAAQADAVKLVLVITGKGARGDEDAGGGGRGVLRRQVPMWLALAEFRPYVIGFEAAHVSHGGDGALYVRVRRGR